jgi:para-aminobenzoate synthetase component 1
LHFDRAGYRRAVAKILNYLAAGDIYQANLTQQFSVHLGGRSCEEIFMRLSAGRAPFRAFLRSPTCTIISDSPERFFHVAGQRIVASPIKGTIARGRNAAEDKARLAALLASGKDRAENTMIVDLLRNDLGRICQYQTIGAQLFEVEPLPHLFHLVSHVRGTLRPEVGVLEILRALFPCGSITGAPKIRAMEILAEIERVPRGISMGAIGIILGAPGGEGWEMDFNVAIRTMMIHEDVAIFNAGGGIVSDSQADSEYAELMLKARPLLQALGVAMPEDRE